MKRDHYYSNHDLEQIIQAWAGQYPGLLAINSLGNSHEGRPIWLLVLSNQINKPHTEKPAVWIDANIHATEVTGTTTALAIAHTLLSGYGQDARCTRLLDEVVYYIVPRVNPDGAELALSENPRYIRSGVRRYPWPEKDPGLHEEDIDQDGRILQMRLLDPNGDWKISSLDPRLMEKRLPTEQGGEYYRLLPEGTVHEYDGHLIPVARPPEGLDFNRNFPFEWRPENEQHGAGPFPASEPEIKALLDFISQHPNINLAVSYHTFSRAILRPYSTKADEEMETQDLWVYKKIGELGTQQTGYRCVSTFHDFKYHPKEITTGAFDDWLYDHLGMFCFTIELWDLPTESGIKDRKFIDWFREHPPEEDLQILKWVEGNTIADGYVSWYPFNHPQLGPVELGGWDFMYTWRNPPPGLLSQEVERNIPFALSLGEILPQLRVKDLELTDLGSREYHLNLVVENTGFLPTFTSLQGKKRQAARPVRVELEIPANCRLVSGKLRTELGHLEGRSNKLEVSMIWGESPTDNRSRAEWVIHADAPADVQIHVRSERAGNLHRAVSLGDGHSN